MKWLCVVFTVLLLSSCNSKASDEYQGVWEYNETYILTIEQNGKTITAEFYGRALGDDRYLKRIYPASIKDGVLSITHTRGAIPVVYDATDQSLTLRGRQKFKKLSSEEATVRISLLDERAAQQEADKAKCNELQALIDEKRRNKPSKKQWHQYLDEEFNPQIPRGCIIIGNEKGF